MVEETWHDDGPGAVTTADEYGNVTTVERRELGAPAKLRRILGFTSRDIPGLILTAVLAVFGVYMILGLFFWSDPILVLDDEHRKAIDAMGPQPPLVRYTQQDGVILLTAIAATICFFGVKQIRRSTNR